MPLYDLYRGTSLIRNDTSLGPTVGACLGPYGGPRGGGGGCYGRGAPVVLILSHHCWSHDPSVESRDHSEEFEGSLPPDFWGMRDRICTALKLIA